MIFYFAFSGLLNFITSSVLAGIFLFKSRNHRFFVLFNIGIALWSLFYFLWLMSTQYDQALMFCRFLMVGAALIPWFFINFIFELESATFNWKNKFNLINATIGLSFIPFLFSNLIIQDLYSTSYFPFWPRGGPLFLVFLGYFLFNVVWAHFILYKSYIKTRNSMTLFIFIATFIAFTGGCTNYFLWLKIPIPPFGNIFVSLYVVLMAFAITKLGAMDINIAINRTSSLLITVASYSIFYATLLFVYRNALSTQIDLTFVLWTALYVLVTGLTFEKSWLFLQTSNERKWIKKNYDPVTLLTHLDQTLGSSLEKEILLIESAKVFLLHMELSFVQAFLPLGEDVVQELKFVLKDNDIIEAENKRYLQMPQALAETSLIDLEKNKITLSLKQDSQPEVIYVLGKKLSERAFTPKDGELCAMVLNRLTKALNRAKPYEDIRLELETVYRQQLEDTQNLLAQSQKIASLMSFMNEYHHELKSPWASIVTMASIPDISVEELQETIKEQYQRTYELMNTMIAILKGELVRKESSINMSELIQKSLKLFKIRVGKVLTQFEATEPIRGSELDLQILFINLFKNAVEAMNPALSIYNTVTIAVKQIDTWAEVRISDTGTGISQDHLSEIQSFFKDSDTTIDLFLTTKQQGNSVGLGVIRRIVHEHKGSIEVTSVLGEGTEFIMKFPVG